MNFTYNIKYIITLSVIALLILSCNGKPTVITQKLREGEIAYKITYPQEIEGHELSFIYPKEMTLYFKDNRQKLSFKGNLGLYYFDFIFGNEDDTVFTLLKIQLFDVKLYVPTKNKNLLIFSETAQQSSIILTDETKVIAGLTAKKALIKSSNDNNPDFEVWYSDNFYLDNPNQNTPFNQIPGVLLEAEIVFKDVKFKFIADKITQKNVLNDVFQVPADYKITSISEIDELLSTVF
jgi:hypothetical protein